MGRALQIAFFALIVQPFLRLFIGLRVRGRENLPSARPLVLIANHASHLDAVALMSLFPLRELARLRPCAASDYFERNRLVSWLSHTFIGILPIDRHNIRRENHPMKVMGDALARGETLILFPEGTRGTGETIANLKPGIAHLSEECPDVPIVPVLLVNFGRTLPKGEFVPLPLFCEMRIGKPAALSGTREERLATLRCSLEQLREPR
jgi:1-acyl-sn-glycerol-3-phosphate acyltransferase